MAPPRSRAAVSSALDRRLKKKNPFPNMAESKEEKFHPVGVKYEEPAELKKVRNRL